MYEGIIPDSRGHLHSIWKGLQHLPLQGLEAMRIHPAHRCAEAEVEKGRQHEEEEEEEEEAASRIDIYTPVRSSIV